MVQVHETTLTETLVRDPMERLPGTTKELKCTRILRSRKGIHLAADLIERILVCPCRLVFAIVEKRLAAGGEVVEEFFDPTINRLFCIQSSSLPFEDPHYAWTSFRGARQSDKLTLAPIPLNTDRAASVGDPALV
jgi:hypothetical protein